jgi:hypothetical protein
MVGERVEEGVCVSVGVLVSIGEAVRVAVSDGGTVRLGIGTWVKDRIAVGVEAFMGVLWLLRDLTGLHEARQIKTMTRYMRILPILEEVLVIFIMLVVSIVIMIDVFIDYFGLQPFY